MGASSNGELELDGVCLTAKIGIKPRSNYQHTWPPSNIVGRMSLRYAQVHIISRRTVRRLEKSKIALILLLERLILFYRLHRSRALGVGAAVPSAKPRCDGTWIKDTNKKDGWMEYGFVWMWRELSSPPTMLVGGRMGLWVWWQAALLAAQKKNNDGINSELFT